MTELPNPACTRPRLRRALPAAFLHLLVVL